MKIDDNEKYKDVIDMFTEILQQYNENQKVMSDKLKTVYKHIHYIEKTQGKK